jgi:hypothetical protein
VSAFHRFVAAALTTACASLSVSAAVTFSFTGSVTDDPFGLSSFGAPISGSYTFDPGATDAIAGPAAASYASSGAAFGFGVDVDGTPYAVGGTLSIGILNSIVDQYAVLADDGTLRLELFLEDPGASVFATDALPLAAPPLGSFSFRQFRLFGTDVEFLGTVDTLVCTAGCRATPVPAPSTLALFGVALFGVGAFARRKVHRPAD